MFNRLFTGVATLVLILLLVFGRDFASYLTTSAQLFGESVRGQIPVEFEIDRARTMVTELGPQIKAGRYAVAREEVSLEQLSERIKEISGHQHSAREMLTDLQHQLQSNEPKLEIGQTMYTSAQAAKLAETRFATYRAQEATVRSLKQARDTRQMALDTARQELEVLVAAKQQLAAEVENLEARQRMAEVTQNANSETVDDVHLERTRQLIREIETRVRVEERLAESATDWAYTQQTRPPEADSAKGIANRIADYFREHETNHKLSVAVVE